MNYATGVYTTAGNPASVTLTVTLTPPADSDLDVASVMPGDITFTATAEDPQSADTAVSDPVVADVNVDAVAHPVTVPVGRVTKSGDAALAAGGTGAVTVGTPLRASPDGSERTLSTQT